MKSNEAVQLDGIVRYHGGEYLVSQVYLDNMMTYKLLSAAKVGLSRGV